MLSCQIIIFNAIISFISFFLNMKDQNGSFIIQNARYLALSLLTRPRLLPLYLDLVQIIFETYRGSSVNAGSHSAVSDNTSFKKGV